MKFRNTRWLATLVVLAFVSSLGLSACSASGKPKAEPSASASPAPMTAQEFTNHVGTYVKDRWPHMDKVWPGYNYKNHNLVLFVEGDKPEKTLVTLINHTGMTALQKKDYEGITKPAPGGYGKLEFRGRPSIVLTAGADSLAKPGEDLMTYRTATHELVHFYYQKEEANSESSSRSHAYPANAQPRIYRQLALHALIRAFDKPNERSKYLGEAKFWVNKWKAEFPDEASAIVSADIAEGTAVYTDTFSTVVGNGMSREEFRVAIGKMFYRSDALTSLDAESYALGQVAGFLLDEEIPNWKANFYAEKVTLVDKLLASVKPVEVAADKELSKKITDKIGEDNKAAQVKLKGFLKAKGDTSIPYLKIPVGETENSYSLGGSYLVGAEKEEVSTDFTAQLEAGGKTISLEKATVLNEFTEDGSAFLVIPLVGDYKLEGNLLTVNMPFLKVSQLPIVKKTENGRTTLTAKK